MGIEYQNNDRKGNHYGKIGNWNIGGSGSGKSYFCEQLAGSLNREDVIFNGAKDFDVPLRLMRSYIKDFFGKLRIKY